MSINWQTPKFKAGDKVAICDWNEVIKAIEDANETNWLSIRRRLECARLYGGKSAIVVDWGPDVYGKEGQTDIVNIYRLADESGEIIPFAFMDCMLTRLEPSGAETKSADDAVEEKSTDRPQILKGDIVRFILGETGKEVVEAATIYRFAGKDFKCIWESENYKLRKWNEALANAAESARRAGVRLKEVTAALESLANEKSKKGEQ